jgi:DNA-binding XRE family transcriptional regulator
VPEPPTPPESPGAALVPSPREGRPPFALWLRKWRRGRDLTQGQAADLVGYSRNLWAQLETGGREPSTEFLERLAAHAGLSARVLAQWAHDNGPEPEGPPPHATPHPAPERVPRPPYPPYPGYPGYPPYPPPYPPYPAYPEYPRYPDYPTPRPRARRRRPRRPRHRVNKGLTWTGEERLQSGPGGGGG